jgi:hypothetical protein
MPDLLNRKQGFIKTINYSVVQEGIFRFRYLFLERGSDLPAAIWRELQRRIAAPTAAVVMNLFMLLQQIVKKSFSRWVEPLPYFLYEALQELM